MSRALADLVSARLALGPAALLSLSDAAGLMPMGDAAAKRWMQEQGIVRDLAGRRVVIWGDVLDRLRSIPLAANATARPQPVKKRSF